MAITFIKTKQPIKMNLNARWGGNGKSMEMLRHLEKFPLRTMGNLLEHFTTIAPSTLRYTVSRLIAEGLVVADGAARANRSHARRYMLSPEYASFLRKDKAAQAQEPTLIPLQLLLSS